MKWSDDFFREGAGTTCGFFTQLRQEMSSAPEMAPTTGHHGAADGDRAGGGAARGAWRDGRDGG